MAALRLTLGTDDLVTDLGAVAICAVVSEGARSSLLGALDAVNFPFAALGRGAGGG